MELSQKQREIVNSTARFRVVNAGRRFGKTILSCEEMIGVAVSKNDQRIAYIAPTFQQARDIAWDHLKSRCQPIIKETNESQLKLIIKTQEGGTSVVQLKSWDAVETLRGQKFHFIVVDEVAMMRNFWSGWLEVLRPALTDTKGQALFISTPKGFNHFYDLYNLQEETDEFQSFHATTYDNPHIDPEEIEAAKKQLPEDQFAQEYLADFRKQEGLIYKEFDRDRHVVDDEWLETFRAKGIVGRRAGVDWGWANPAAAGAIEKSRDGVYVITDEFYEKERHTEDICDEVTLMKVEAIYPDPAEPDRIDIAKRKGLRVKTTSKDVVAGIATLQQLFAQNRLFVHKRCRHFIEEIEMYSYKERQPNKNLPEEPVKENDHMMDAVRYCLHAWENIEDAMQGFRQHKPVWEGTGRKQGSRRVMTPHTKRY